MVALRPRQRPYTPSRPPDEPVIVDVEHRLEALDAARLTVAGTSDTWADYAAARPTLEEFWPAPAPDGRSMPGGRVWHVTSLGEWETAGVALGDGPAGPEAIAGRPASRWPRRKPARRHRASADSPAWSGTALPALSNDRPDATYLRPRGGPSPPVLDWRWPFYMLLCGPFLLLGRVRWLRGATGRTLTVVAAVIGVLVTTALVVELQQRSGVEAPVQAQPTAEVVAPQPPSEAVPAPTASAVSVGAGVVVANTDGQGVYLRHQPAWSSKWVAWDEGTRLHVLAAGVSGTGAAGAISAGWLQVRDPEGRVGYVPEQFTELTSSP